MSGKAPKRISVRQPAKGRPKSGPRATRPTHTSPSDDSRFNVARDQAELRAIRKASDRFGALDPLTGKPKPGSNVKPRRRAAGGWIVTPEQDAVRAARKRNGGGWVLTPEGTYVRASVAPTPAAASMSGEGSKE